jgi:quercetin dioxygenase-like cupin family protein
MASPAAQMGGRAFTRIARITMRAFLLVGASLLLGASLAAQTPDSSGKSGKTLSWGPAPAVFPAGVKMAVLSGDPTAAGPFTVQLSMPAGYRIMPHTHPTDERVTVRKGTLLVGMGDTFDVAKTNAMATGASGNMAANMSHFVQAKGATVVEVSTTGPFAMAYVNPSDDPSRKAAP